MNFQIKNFKHVDCQIMLSEKILELEAKNKDLETKVLLLESNQPKVKSMDIDSSNVNETPKRKKTPEVHRHPIPSLFNPVLRNNNNEARKH